MEKELKDSHQKELRETNIKALNFYGAESQLRCFASECCEAASKAIDLAEKRTKLDGAGREQMEQELIEEAADVLNTLEYLKIIFSEERILEASSRKLKKFQQKMEKDKLYFRF